MRAVRRPVGSTPTTAGSTDHRRAERGGANGAAGPPDSISEEVDANPVSCYDLRALTAADRSWKQGGLTYTLAIVAILGVELTLVVRSPSGTLPEPDGAWAIGLITALLGGILLGLLGVRRLLPGATAVEVNATGMVLVYPRGRCERLSWDEPRRLTLRDAREDEREVRAGTALQLRSGSYFRRRSLLTDPAFRAVLDAARKHGARIRRRPARAPGAMGPIVYRVRFGC